MARSGYEVAKLLATDNEVFITDMKEQDEDKVKELEEKVEIVQTELDFSVKEDEFEYEYSVRIKDAAISFTIH